MKRYHQVMKKIIKMILDNISLLKKVIEQNNYLVSLKENDVKYSNCSANKLQLYRL